MNKWHLNNQARSTSPLEVLIVAQEYGWYFERSRRITTVSSNKKQGNELLDSEFKEKFSSKSRRFLFNQRQTSTRCWLKETPGSIKINRSRSTHLRALSICMFHVIQVDQSRFQNASNTWWMSNINHITRMNKNENNFYEISNYMILFLHMIFIPKN